MNDATNRCIRLMVFGLIIGAMPTTLLARDPGVQPARCRRQRRRRSRVGSINLAQWGIGDSSADR